jgi:hypothetical protein
MKKNLRSGLKSTNRTNVLINKNFVIRVVIDPKKNKKTQLTTANKLSGFVNDEELKNKLFKKALSSPLHKVTFLIRNRLKVEFCSK